MPDDQGDIGQAQNGQSTSNDQQKHHSSPHNHQDNSVRQKGDRATNVRDISGGENQIGDHHYHGASFEDIKAIVQELRQLQTPQTHPAASSDGSVDLDDLLLTRIVPDPITLENIDTRLKLIKEIADARGFTEAHQQELNQLKQQLQEFQSLNRTLLQLERQSDLLIESAVADMRQQLEELKSQGAKLTNLSPKDQNCHDAETEMLENFVKNLGESRLGSAWIDENLDTLKKYARKQVIKQFPDLGFSEQQIDDFQFSIKQFLEQISFCLYWGDYDILDSPNIPLELGIEQYEAAFLAIKKSVSPRLRNETIEAIKACIDYLMARLPFLDID